MGGPNINGRTSICSWSLRADFKTKYQAKTAIKKILDQDIDFNVEYEKYYSETDELYSVVITGMFWAENLSTVAEILKEVDYKMDDE